jgi:hypothetical protein
MRKQRAIRHADVAEEPLDPIKEGAQAFAIVTRRYIFARKALAKRVISRTSWTALSGSAGLENSEVALVHYREGERAQPAENTEKSRQSHR